MKYNTETRREDGTFSRSGDWGATPPKGKEEVYSGDNFTDVAPPEETLKYGVPCDWDGKQWVLDTGSDEYLAMYQQKRAAEYPPLKEQLDMLFHDIDNAKVDKTGTLYAALKAVKDKYPKP
jgi:hypothetical protein